jgi:hypothetical protein
LKHATIILQAHITLLNASWSDWVQAEIQARYETHRSNRGVQQKEKLTSPDFAGVTIDTILAKLEDQTIEPGFKDPRHCLVFWARPPPQVKAVIAEVQKRLKAVTPSECHSMQVTNLTS